MDRAAGCPGRPAGRGRGLRTRGVTRRGYASAVSWLRLKPERTRRTTTHNDVHTSESFSGIEQQHCVAALARRALGFWHRRSAVARILCSGEIPHVTLTHIFNLQRDPQARRLVPTSVTWTESIDDVLKSDADIMIELTGGLRPTYDWVKGALLAGKSVVTANKQLMAHHGAELIDLARSRGLELRFEASVAGGIPVPARCRKGSRAIASSKCAASSTGTCAYILSRMQNERSRSMTCSRMRSDSDTQKPTQARTLTARMRLRNSPSSPRSACAGQSASPRSRRRSIRPIEPVDFEYARELGCTIRQIARASAEDNGTVFAAVRPALVPISSGFGRVEGSQNLVTVRGIFGGETSFFGSGAGGSPTAVAVVSDVISVASRGTASHPPTAPTTFHKVSGDFVAPHYVRFTVNDKPGILAQITAAYARYGINIDGVLQLPKFLQGPAAVCDDARRVLGVGARPRTGGRGAERLSRAAAAGAADLLVGSLAR